MKSLWMSKIPRNRLAVGVSGLKLPASKGGLDQALSTLASSKVQTGCSASLKTSSWFPSYNL